MGSVIATADGNVEAFRLLVFVGTDANLKNNYGETAITLSEANKNSAVSEKVTVLFSMSKHALEKGSVKLCRIMSPASGSKSW